MPNAQFDNECFSTRRLSVRSAYKCYAKPLTGYKIKRMNARLESLCQIVESLQQSDLRLNCGMVSADTIRQIEELERTYDERRAQYIKRLHRLGYCGEDGITPDDWDSVSVFDRLDQEDVGHLTDD